MNTPDTEWEANMQVETLHSILADISSFEPDGEVYTLVEQAHTELAKLRTIILSRDTYWKEREAKKDDLLDDMWGLICNVNGGIVEDEKPDWYEAFFRIREKYFKQITPH